MKILYLLLFCIVATHSWASEGEGDKKKRAAKDSTIRVIFDCYTNTFIGSNPFDKTIDWKNGVTIELRNINTFLYKVSIQEQQKNTVLISSESQKLPDFSTSFSLNQFPVDFGKLSQLNYLQAKIPISSEKGVKEAEEKYQKGRIKVEVSKSLLSKLVMEQESVLDVIKKQETELNILKAKADSIKKTGSNVIEKRDSIMTELLIKDIEQKKKEINSIGSKIVSANVVIETSKSDEFDLEKEYNRFSSINSDLKVKIKFLNETLEVYKNSVLEIRKIDLFYQQVLGLCYSQNLSPQQIIESKDTLAKRMFTAVNKADLMQSLFQIRENIDQNITQYIDASQTLIYSFDFSNDELKKYRQFLEEQESKIRDYHKQIDYSLLRSSIEKTVKLYDAINLQNFTILYHSYLFDDDATEVAYKIIGEPVPDPPFAMAGKPINIPFSLPIRKGLKIDFSTGLFVNFIPQAEYFFEKDTDTTVKVNKRNDPNSYVPNIGYLFHFYQRGSKWGGAIGASTGLDGKSLKYYLGGSWMHGRSQRLIISAGLAGSQLQRPIQSQSVGSILKTPEYSVTKTVLTTAAWRVGAFISFTFNLTGSNNKQGSNIVTYGNIK